MTPPNGSARRSPGGSPQGGSPRGGKPSGGGKPNAKPNAKSNQGKGGGRTGSKPARAARPDETDTVAQLAGPLRKVLARLPEIERRVVELRMGLTDGHPTDLADTARALGLTPHETKQIEERAFSRIREVVPVQHLQKFLSS